MKKEIMYASILSLSLLVLSSFSFSGEPYNVAAGKYVLIPEDVNNPVHPFYDGANNAEVHELLVLSADEIWTLLITSATTGVNGEKELLVGRYQIKDDKVIFLDDTNCCTFAGKIAGDRLIVKPEESTDNFLFVRINSKK